MFYDRFKLLAEELGKSVFEVTQDLNLGNSTAAKWKRTKALPSSENLRKISEYFEVPVSFFLESGIFKHWEYLYLNRNQIVNTYRQRQRLTPDIDDTIYPVIDYINFLDNVVLSVDIESRSSGTFHHVSFKNNFDYYTEVGAASRPPNVLPVLDEDALALMEEMHKRPELKVLFSTSKHATREDIETVDKLLRRLAGVDNDEDYTG